MIQITINQNGYKSVHVCSTDKKAQQFLEHMHKTHIERYGLQKIESLKKQCYNKRQKNTISKDRKYVSQKYANKVEKELKALPVKPSSLKVEIRRIEKSISGLL